MIYVSRDLLYHMIHFLISNFNCSLSIPQTTPPMYDVTKLSVPTYLFTGNKDFLADPKDVSRLISNLKPNLGDKLQRVNIPSYEHLDFIWGINANKLIYDVILEDAKKIVDGR